MLIVHLFFGFIFGALAVVAAVLLGLSSWGGVGCYVVGANVGLLASVSAMLWACSREL